MPSFLYSDIKESDPPRSHPPDFSNTATSTIERASSFLPPDIIDYILQFNDIRSIKSLSLTNKSFRSAAIRYLFSSLHVFEHPGSSLSLPLPLSIPISLPSSLTLPTLLTGPGQPGPSPDPNLNFPPKKATPSDLRSFFERYPHALPCVRRLNIHLDPAFFPWLWGVFTFPLTLSGISSSTSADDDSWSFLSLLSNLTTLQLCTTPAHKIVAYRDLHPSLRARLSLLYPTIEGLYISGISNFPLSELERCERLKETGFSRVIWTDDWAGESSMDDGHRNLCSLSYIHIDLSGAGRILQWLHSSRSTSLEEAYHVSIEMGDPGNESYIPLILDRVKNKVEMLSFDFGRGKFYTYNLQTNSYIMNGPIQISVLRPRSNARRSVLTPSIFPSLTSLSFCRSSIHFNDTFSVSASPDFDDFEGALNQVRGEGERLGRFYTSHVPEIVGILRSIGKVHWVGGGSGSTGGGGGTKMGNNIRLVIINLEFDCFETDVRRVNWDDLVCVLESSESLDVGVYGATGNANLNEMSPTGLRFEDENPQQPAHTLYAPIPVYPNGLPNAHAASMSQQEPRLFPRLKNVILRVGWSKRVKGVVKGGDDALVGLVRNAIGAAVGGRGDVAIGRVDAKRLVMLGRTKGSAHGYGGEEFEEGEAYDDASEIYDDDGEYYDDDDEFYDDEYEEGGDAVGRIVWSVEPMGGWDAYYEEEEDLEGGFGANNSGVRRGKARSGGKACGGNERRGRARVGVDLPCGNDAGFFVA